MRIMVVDDCPLLALTIAELVRDCGHTAEIFTGGEAAVAAYADGNWHMVLVDQLMPGLDGLDVTRAIRKQQAASGWRPILMVSGFSSAEEQVAALHAGCDDFLPKPVNAAILAAKISAFGRIFDLQEQLTGQNRTLLQLQAERNEEARVAEQLMKRLVLRAELDRKVLQHFVRATQQLSGDLIMATSNAVGDRYIMLADATGHGLPAALTQIPLSQTFYAMAARGFSLVSIVAEMNIQHRRYAPVHRSVAVALAVHRVCEQTLEVWNGGMPEALLVGDGGRIIRRFASLNLPLGVESDINYYRDSEVTVLHQPCHLMLCSDGVLEAENAKGEWFGSHGIELALANAATAATYCWSLQQAVDRHLQGGVAHDDLSCLVLDCSESRCQLDTGSAIHAGQLVKGNGHWRLQVSLNTLQLRQMDVVPTICSWLGQLGLAQRDSARLSLILSELVTNAIDHGLLQLDSGLKNGVSGFERYSRLRRERLDVLMSGALSLDISQLGHSAPVCILLGDSGSGFDWQRVLLATAGEAYHGRGLALVRALSQRLEFRGAGNEIYVELAPAQAQPDEGAITPME